MIFWTSQSGWLNRLAVLSGAGLSGVYCTTYSVNCDGQTCPDNSHLIVEPNCGTGTFEYSGCERNFEVFPCLDGNKCIHTSLLCDGYEQCDDGSDEEPRFCEDCTRTRGYSKSGDIRAATLKCLHRYTMRPICAVPCNHVDDMCYMVGYSIQWTLLNVTTSGPTLFSPNKRLVLLTGGFIYSRLRLIQPRLIQPAGLTSHFG